MSLQFTERVSSCVNVCIEMYDGEGKCISRRRLQWPIDLPEQCRDDAEREAAFMRRQTSLKLRTEDEWVQMIEENFGDNPKLKAAIASVCWWDYCQHVGSDLWNMAMSVGRKVNSVDHKLVNEGLSQLGYVKPAYRAMTLRRRISDMNALKLSGGKVVVVEK